MGDDEINEANVGVFWEAPGWKDEDFYGFLVLQRVFGSYSME